MPIPVLLLVFLFPNRPPFVAEEFVVLLKFIPERLGKILILLFGIVGVAEA